LALLGISGLLHAAQSQAFDLNCKINRMAAYDGGKPTQLLDEPIDASFRIDLTEGRYCSGECKETKPIYRVTQTTIILDFVRTPDDKGSERIEKVSRESGSYVSQLWYDGQTSMVTLGACSPAPFTGFPKRKF
jgi:hypothetical protein